MNQLLSQKEIILRYLEDVNDWVHEYKIRAMSTRHGWIGARGDRDVRDLIKSGKVDSSYDGKYRIVRFKETAEKPKEEIKIGVDYGYNQSATLF